jgi:hypothetical protein
MPEVRRITAETLPELTPSIGVLRQGGFRPDRRRFRAWGHSLRVERWEVRGAHRCRLRQRREPEHTQKEVTNGGGGREDNGNRDTDHAVP